MTERTPITTPALPGGLPFDATQVQFTQAGTGALSRSVQSKQREIVSVTDFYANGGSSGAAVDPTGVIDSTGGAQAAINSLVGKGGICHFPQGKYKVTFLLLNTTESITLSGVQEDYSSGNAYGSTIFAADGVVEYLISIKKCVNIGLRYLNLDGKALKTSVVLMDQVVAAIDDFHHLDHINFYNVKNSGDFITSSAALGVGGENAIISLTYCTFQLNGSAIPSSKGTAINLNNNNAWNWYADKCNFFGDSKDQAITLTAGALTLRDCEFENNTKFDIVKYESAKLSVYNVQSQSPGVFLSILPLVNEGTNWTRKRTVLENVYHFAVGGGPPAYSVIDDTGAPLKIDNLEGYGVQINYTGSYKSYTHKDLDISNTLGVAIGIGAAKVDVQVLKSQPTDAGYISRRYDKTLVRSLDTRYDSATDAFVDTGPQTAGGVVLQAGADRVSNGAFTSTTTSWTAIASATLSSVAGGQAGNGLQIARNGVDFPGAEQAITTGAGRMYRLSAYHKNGTSQGFLRVSTASGISGNIFDSGTMNDVGFTLKSIIFTATGVTTYIGMLADVQGGAGATTLFDTVSVTEIPAAIQTDLVVTGLPIFANNAAAITGGLIVGSFYRTNANPDTVCVVH
jgi:hypothetical protein